jgi:hypothetical protein
MGDIKVTCGSGASQVIFPIDPTDAPGNQSVTVGSHTLTYAIYRDTEELDCGATSCGKLFWNLAFNLEDLEALGTSCSVEYEATAAAGTTEFVTGLLPADRCRYPYIRYAVDLTGPTGEPICSRSAVDQTTRVSTVYRGSCGGTPPTMCDVYDGTTATGTGASLSACAGDPPPPRPPVRVQAWFERDGIIGSYNPNCGGPKCDQPLTNKNIRFTRTLGEEFWDPPTYTEARNTGSTGYVDFTNRVSMNAAPAADWPDDSSWLLLISGTIIHPDCGSSFTTVYDPQSFQYGHPASGLAGDTAWATLGIAWKGSQIPSQQAPNLPGWEYKLNVYYRCNF